MTKLKKRLKYLSIILFNFNIKTKNRLNVLKDTNREKAPSNKTPALTKSTNMNIWLVGTSNQLFKTGS